MSNKGSAILESALSMIFVFTLLAGTLQLSRAMAAHFWLSDVLYRYLICLEEGQNSIICRHKAEEASRSMPLGTNTIRLSHQKNYRSTRGRLDWQGWGELHLNLAQDLELRAK